MKKNLFLGALVFGVCLASLAQANQDTASADTTVAKKDQVPWRGSVFTYENIGNYYARYNPYYGMAFDLKPRWYFRDDLNLAARMIFDVELTLSDETNSVREPVVSDLFFDLNYAPEFLKIPVLDVAVKMNLRLILPTSKTSRGRSMVAALAPGLTFSREFKLRKGKFLPNISLSYGFQASKYFHEYTDATIDITCSNPNRPECQHSGRRNQNWRLSNVLGAILPIIDEKLTFSAYFFLLNDLLYKSDAQQIEIAAGHSVAVNATQVNQRVYTWAIFELSYSVLPWLELAVG
ncbi:MAG: hypothetical protein V1754_06515, partial [Pseudomonadota bacterium]